jgi:hypothetical protein
MSVVESFNLTVVLEDISILNNTVDLSGNEVDLALGGGLGITIINVTNLSIRIRNAVFAHNVVTHYGGYSFIPPHCV